MTYYSCEKNWESILSCIYDAWSSKKGHANIRLIFEPVEQYTLFDEYIHVDADFDKTQKVSHAINTKISPQFYKELAYCGLSYEEDSMDIIYRMMILGFAYGPSVLERTQYKEVMRFIEIHRRVLNDVYRFQEILRFHEVRPGVYVAHIEPKCRVIEPLAPIFVDRMPSEHWMIVDDTHKEVVVHQKDERCVFMKLTGEELDELLATENANDEYTDLWKLFFHSIAIKERLNPKCQQNHFPLWARKHAVEFE